MSLLSEPDERQVLEVIGPEGVPLSFPAAGISERAFAFLIDLLIISIAFGLILVFSVYLMGMLSMLEPAMLIMVGLFGLRYGYFAGFEIYWQGSTPGKRLMNLKVISRDGTGLTSEAIIARNLMRDVELFLPLIAILSPSALFGETPWWLTAPLVLWLIAMMLLPFYAKERTRVGDLVGGTVVVRVPRVALIADEAALARNQGIRFSPAQLAHYGESELETLAKLLRDAEAGHASTSDLSVVSQTIARKIGYHGPSSDPAAFLRAFYAAQRTALEKRLLFGRRKATKHER